MRFSPGRDDSSMPVTTVTGDVSSVDSKVPEGRQQISPHALSSLPGLSSFWWLYPSAIADGNEPPSLPGLNRFLCFHSASLFSTQNPSRRCPPAAPTRQDRLQSRKVSSTSHSNFIGDDSLQWRILWMTAFFIRVVAASIVAADECPARICTDVLI